MPRMKLLLNFTNYWNSRKEKRVMAVKAISQSYWRSIKRGNRTFDSIKDEAIKDDVRILAKSDVENGEITAAEYEQFIGEPYYEG